MAANPDSVLYREHNCSIPFNLPIMKLPQFVHEKLARILDPRDYWKILASQMSKRDTYYTAEEIMGIETVGQKPGSSPTELFLRDLNQRGFDVQDLINGLRKCGSYQAVWEIDKGLKVLGFETQEIRRIGDRREPGLPHQGVPHQGVPDQGVPAVHMIGREEKAGTLGVSPVEHDERPKEKAGIFPFPVEHDEHPQEQAGTLETIVETSFTYLRRALIAFETCMYGL